MNLCLTLLIILQYLFFQLNRDQRVVDHSGKYIEEKCLTDVLETMRIRYGERMYNLRQVIQHTGKGTQSGHYTTYDVEEMKVFDDSPPSFKSATDEMMSTAKRQGYIYLYQIDENIDRYDIYK